MRECAGTWCSNLEGGSAMVQSLAPDDGAENPLELRRVLAILRRRRKAIAIGFALAIGPAIGIPMLLPERFEASVTIQLERTPEALDFGAAVLPGRNLEALVAVVSSDNVLGRVADTLPAEVPEPGGFGILRGARRVLGLGSNEGVQSAEQARQARIEALRGHITLSQAGGGSVLVVWASAGDPETAAYLANAVTDAYLAYERDRRQNASRVATSWLSQKILELRDQVTRGEEELAEVAKRSGLRPGRPMAAPDALRVELRTAELELEGLDARIAEIRPRGSPAPARSPEERALEEQLATAQRSLAEARLRYRETHPEVERLQEIVTDLERRHRVDGGDGAPDPETARELRVLQADRARLRARAGALEKSVGGDDGDPKALARYSRVERELAVDRQTLETLLRRLNETTLAAVTQEDEVHVLDRAVPPSGPVAPRRNRAVLIGMGVALAFSLGIGVLLELLDSAVYDPRQVAAALGCPYVGSIPALRDGRPAELQAFAASGTLGSESYRTLRTSLLFAIGNPRLGSLLVTSGVAGEGKTTVSVNLAASFAASGKRVLLIDADLRRPRVDRVLALKPSPGLAEVLLGGATIPQAVQRPLGIPFDVITSGELPENPSELLGSERFSQCIAECEASYDAVIVDTPVLIAVTDAMLLASRIHNVLLVHRLGTLPAQAFSEIREGLRLAGARTLGVVMNLVDASNHELYPSYRHSPYVLRSQRRRSA